MFAAQLVDAPDVKAQAVPASLPALRADRADLRKPRRVWLGDGRLTGGGLDVLQEETPGVSPFFSACTSHVDLVEGGLDSSRQKTASQQPMAGWSQAESAKPSRTPIRRPVAVTGASLLARREPA